MESQQTSRQSPVETPSHAAPPASTSSFIDHDMFSTWQYMDYDVSPTDNHSDESNVPFGSVGAPTEAYTTQPLVKPLCFLQDSPTRQGDFSSSFFPTTLQDDHTRAMQGSVSSLTGKPGQTSSIGQRSKVSDRSDSVVSPTDSLPHTHDCEEHGLELLRSLQLCALHALKAPNMTAFDSTEQPASRRNTVNDDPPSTPGFDKILLANKFALGHVMNLSDCPCVRHPHVVLLYLSIVTKALFWYKKAALMLLTCAPKPIDSSLLKRNNSRPSMVQIGGFDLDDDDQEDLMREILVRELRRVGKALTKLSSVSGANTDGDILVNQWHSHFFSAAHRDLQEAVRSLKTAR